MYLVVAMQDDYNVFTKEVSLVLISNLGMGINQKTVGMTAFRLLLY